MQAARIPAPSQPQIARRRPRRVFARIVLPLGALALAALMVLAAAPSAAVAQGGAQGPSLLTASKVVQRARRTLERMGAQALTAVGASRSQRAALVALERQTGTQLRRHLREVELFVADAVGVLAAPEVERAEVERLRRQAVVGVERLSQLAADVVVEACATLDAGQRQQLLAWLRQQL